MSQTSQLLSGQYELRELIGSGGMAKVYLGWDLKYDRLVAIKIMHAQHLKNEDFVQRFKAEASMISQLSHPNIVNMYDTGQEGAKPYIVMEYVRGTTLRQIMEREKNRFRRDFKCTVDVILKILAALHHAHRNNIAHLDIKPQNILASEDLKKVKVADFGISRMINTTTSSMTDEGHVMGSAYYFSPEQAAGKKVDGRSDLYSVGVVLYEMVTGQKPFDGESAREVALKHMEEAPVPPSEINPAVSRGLEEVILKALRKDASKRYQSAQEFAWDLKLARRYPEGGFLSDRKRHAVNRHKEKIHDTQKTWITVAFTAILIALLSLGAVYGWQLYERMQMRVHVPDLRMSDIDEALARLEAQGLSGKIESQYHDEVISGIVFGQSPNEGMLAYPGEEITLYVSMGKESIEVPAVSGIGLNRSDAEKILSDAGLVSGGIVLEISEEKVGTVIRQEPKAGEKVQPFTEVVLYVSGESAVVPKLDNLTVELARSTLAASGFVLGDVHEKLSEIEPGLVIAQSVAAGERALVGESVDITISQVIPESYYAEVNVTVRVEKSGDEILCMLTDASGNTREVYRDTANTGEQTIKLKLDSYVQGVHTLSIYMQDELIDEQSVVFE